MKSEQIEIEEKKDFFEDVPSLFWHTRDRINEKINNSSYKRTFKKSKWSKKTARKKK